MTYSRHTDNMELLQDFESGMKKILTEKYIVMIEVAN